jgi:D-cysteine desulfhydrase family pyridoxal phosphate-dependent enzyme
MDKLDAFPRVKLADLPTAIDEAPRLAKEIGLDRLLIKRDDNTGLAMGGNKARKLEFLMADAQALGAKVVLTCGSAQSNHVRMTAAAAKKMGMDALLILPDKMPKIFTGNLMLDTILGAELKFAPEIDYAHIQELMEEEAKRLTAEGRTAYVIPVGGSNPIGSLGYVDAAREVAGQLAELGISKVDMFVALGSTGTFAGLVAGCNRYMPDARAFGVSVVRPETTCRPTAEKEIAGTSALLGDPADFSRAEIRDAYVGDGYAIPTTGCKEAILLTARTEGLILDPVYTGKAMAGLIDLARKGEIGDRPVLFWHTGGTPGLFAHESLFHDEVLRLTINES